MWEKALPASARAAYYADLWLLIWIFPRLYLPEASTSWRRYERDPCHESKIVWRGLRALLYFNIKTKSRKEEGKVWGPQSQRSTCSSQATWDYSVIFKTKCPFFIKNTKNTIKIKCYFHFGINWNEQFNKRENYPGHWFKNQICQNGGQEKISFQIQNKQQTKNHEGEGKTLRAIENFFESMVYMWLYCNAL